MQVLSRLSHSSITERCSSFEMPFKISKIAQKALPLTQTLFFAKDSSLFQRDKSQRELNPAKKPDENKN